jgi:hypothetical protein
MNYLAIRVCNSASPALVFPDFKVKYLQDLEATAEEYLRVDEATVYEELASAPCLAF